MPSLMRVIPVPRYPNTSSNYLWESTSEASARTARRRFSTRNSVEFSRSRSPTKSSINLGSQPAKLEIKIESPPLVCYGPPSESSGCLLSGILNLNVRALDVRFESLALSLKVIVTTKRPVSPYCPGCASRVTELNRWEFISGSVQAKKGDHSYPFSFLVPGHLAASTNSSLATVKYMLLADGRTTLGDEIKDKREIHISRAILPGQDRHSLRVFPPTSLSANVNLPPVVHLGGDFPVEVRLNGVVNKEKSTRWGLRKMSWRIDENAKVISPACSIHAPRLGIDVKGIPHEDHRPLAAAEHKNGWKSDFEAADGKIEMQFQAGIPAGIFASNDVESPCGIVISHNLILEMIVAEEYLQKNTRLITPTGAARVLRMQFKLFVTNHGGLGISWEDECPPLYSDIPNSPPTYNASCDDLDEPLSSDDLPEI